MNSILIIVAMKFEASDIVKRLGLQQLEEQRPFQCYTGMINKCRVYVAAGGVGKVNAAAATAALIERVHPDLVINTGCAGAYYNRGLAIGDLAIANEETLGDEGASTSAGWLDLKEMNLPSFSGNGPSCFNLIPVSLCAHDRAMTLAEQTGTVLVSGRFITVSSCSGSLSSGEIISHRFNGIAENMEGAAVALTCLRYGIDCLEIRGISNMVDERDLEKWDIRLAVANAQNFVLKYLEHIVTD
jgi:futalosine hydrolase